MKALRYLLIVIAMVSFLGVNAQGLAQRPEVKMQSTSGMVSSGSTLPSAAVQGTYVTGTTIGTYSSADADKPSGPNRAKKERPDDWDDPYKDPLGDAGWPLAMLAAAWMLRVYMRSRSANRS